MAVVNTHNVALALAERADPALLERHLPALLAGRTAACTALTEPQAGSDFAAAAMRARPDGDGWHLDGEKTWLVNGRRAGLAIVYAQCGQPGERDGIAAFAVALEGETCTRHAIDSPFSQTSIGAGGFTLRDHPVPREALLLAPGEAFRAILEEINGARAYVAAMCVGMLEAAVTEARAYGATRAAFGRPLAGHQAWRLALAEVATDLAAARALTREAVAAVEARHPDAQRLAAQAKIHAAGACVRRLPELMHLAGAEGLSPHRPFARHLAAAQAATLTDGSTEMLLERVARLLGPA
jgi:alkylation response protein AidB-like acyl-CoA dehydrogenase